jgi:hypothetical protein
MRTTVDSIMANKNCPLCRLLAHYVLSITTTDSITRTMQLALSLTCSFLSLERDTSTNIVHKSKKRPYYLEIHMCAGSHDRHTDQPSHYGGIVLPIREEDRYERHSDLVGRTFPSFGPESLVQARQFPRSVDLGLLRAWSALCYEQHNHCKSWTSTSGTETHLRLIDVQKRCLVKSTLQEQYIALSYVCGKTTTGVLTKATLDIFYCEGSLSGKLIPRLVVDVMELTAKLGERYLWVDTACIIQDDLHDKQQQLPIMDSIYSHAALTVIATVEGAHSGLPRWISLRNSTTTGSRTGAEPSIEVLNGISTRSVVRVWVPRLVKQYRIHEDGLSRKDF